MGLLFGDAAISPKEQRNGTTALPIGSS